MEFFESVITQDAKRKALECLDSGLISEGLIVKEFEQTIEEKFEYKNCVAVNSCTSALHLALLSAGVHRNDEVIIPAQTFIATGLAVLYCDAKPVFADIEEKTGNINYNEVEHLITKNTKAILAVSWGGNPCRLDALNGLCEQHKVTFIQDNAQAFGATYYGVPVGNISDYSCFSFQAIKHLTTGDGGMISCKDEQSANYIKKLRWFGIDRDNDIPDELGERAYTLNNVGYKYHMNNLSASIGLGNLNGFDERLNKRRKIAHMYTDHLPVEILTEWHTGSACWLYTVLVERRLDFVRMMKAKNIPVSVVHSGIQTKPLFEKYKKDSLPVQEYWDEHHICLPIHSSLTDEDVDKVIRAVNGGW
jgi:perosamine synthetase